jgi:hypothetical protein
MNSIAMTTEPSAHPTTAVAPQTKSFTRFFPIAARVLMGLAFFISGLNGFLNFLPQPKTVLPEGAMAFAGALMKTGYMMPLIFGTQLIVGALLLSNRFVPLALVLIAPFLVNSVAFHVFLEPSGLVMACIFAAFEIYLAWVYRRAYAPLLTPRSTPA